MNAFRSYRLGLLALMLTTLVLSACGDNPTPAPAATAAASTTAAPTSTIASTTVAATSTPAPTAAPNVVPATAAPTLAPTTTAPTVAPTATIAQPTTAPVAGGFPVPTGTRPFTLSPAIDKIVFGDFGTATGPGISTVKITTYVVSVAPDKLTTFYGQAMNALGYTAHPETNTKDVTENVSFLTANFTKGTQATFIMLMGPLDDAMLNKILSLAGNAGLSQPEADLFKQLKVGDTFIRIFESTGPASTTVAAQPTVAPATAAASGAIPVYPGAIVLKFDSTIEKDLASTQAPGLQNATLKGYASTYSPADIASFYNMALPIQGYTAVPNSQTSQTVGNFTVTTVTFTKGSNKVILSLSGPFDKDNLESVFSDSPDVMSQIKEGSTLILIFSA